MLSMAQCHNPVQVSHRRGHPITHVICVIDGDVTCYLIYIDVHTSSGPPRAKD